MTSNLSPTPDGFYIAMFEDGPLEVVARCRAAAINLMWDAASYGTPQILHIIMAESRVTDVAVDLAEEWLSRARLYHFDDGNGNPILPDWIQELAPSAVADAVERYRYREMLFRRVPKPRSRQSQNPKNQNPRCRKP